METKHARAFELKVSAEGTFTGLLSPYNVKDGGDDIVLPGAYANTLQQKGTTRPLLWSHETRNPVGTVELTDMPDGLHAKGQLLMELAEAQRVFKLIKAGIAQGLSIGFQTVRKDFQNGIRYLKEINLYEASVVVFPMNEAALITSVKGIDHARIEAALQSFKADILRELKGTK